MVEARPSPKRARIDNEPPNAAAIAQTNSTLQVFLGQGNRQNRWMSGYVPPTATNGEGSGEGRPKPSRAGQSPKSAANNVNAERTAHAQHMHSAQQQHEQRRHEAGSDAIVQYESPTTLSTATNNNVGTVGISAPASIATATTMAPPQSTLPSPAPSDDNETSPSMHGAPMPLVYTPLQLATKRRGRPPSTDYRPQAVATGSPASNVRQATTHSRQNSRSSSGSNAVPRTQTMLPPTAHPAPLAHAHPRTVVPSNATAPPQQAMLRPPQYSILSREVMIQRFRELSNTQGLNGVDNGRLTLLRDAIDQYDLGYIVLSQLHALTKNPELIPNSARSLDARSLLYLDFLICSTDQLSPGVLGSLATFPASIMQIYSHAETAAMYEPILQQVTEFLRLLPMHWDRIATESKKREAPPLVEDLMDAFRLPSPVFHKTAFRAIARLVMQSDKFRYSEKGIDRLEHLHTLDQMWFSRFGRRAGPQKDLAYRSFRSTKQAWRGYEKTLRDFEKQAQPQPNVQQQQAPIFVFPRDALEPFQIPVNAASAPANTSLSGPVLQQQLVASNGQLASQHPHITPQPNFPHRFQQHPGANGAMPPQVMPNARFLFPRDGEMPRAQPTNPDPMRSALHQAHLRSPILGPVSGQEKSSEPTLYRHVAGFALPPQRLDKDNPVQKFSFVLSREDVDKVAGKVPSDNAGELPRRTLSESSRLYRLRCVARPRSGALTESTWAASDNYWPDELYLQCNELFLETRRKLQHGRYLPIDLTEIVRAGENTVQAIINRTSTDVRPFDYAIAVEVVGVKSNESIKKDIPVIDPETTLSSIRKSLASSGDSDELAVTSSNLTIRLFEPFSNSKIFDIPARGSACAHTDCFDLDIFLNMCKREKPGWPTVVDCWRCPLCRGDVRPQTLVIDGFLREVRKGLENRGLLKTRAIIVEADGSWKPKPEEKTGVRSPSMDREERSGSEKGRSASAGANAQKKVPEVIEID